MLDTAQNVNSKFVSWSEMIIQIYEIQDPIEAEALIKLGVDHLGSVIVDQTDWKISRVRDTLELVRSTPAKSSLIPLFSSLDSVLRLLDYYQPDVIHFCETLTNNEKVWDYCQKLVQFQIDVKERFPQIMIMRSIPIAKSGVDNWVPTLEFGRRFEAVSDFFLTDTLLGNESESNDDPQPVSGFVGITGRTCNWDTAAELVASSRIPVILAGGISPNNVTGGIVRVRPAGVDSCTQTNALDGAGRPIRFRKDQQKVKQFVEAVRETEKTLE